MSCANIPCEGDGFGCAFDVDGAGTGAAFDVVDGDEFGFRASVCAVKRDASLLPDCFIESGEGEFMAHDGGQYFVGFRVGVEQVLDCFFINGLARKDGTRGAEGEACGEARSRLLCDLGDAHAAEGIGSLKDVVYQRFGESFVVEADEEGRAAWEIEVRFVAAEA